MKNNNFKVLLGLLTVVALFSGCKKDDDDKNSGGGSNTQNNVLTYDGTNYPVNKGYLEYYGQENDDPASYNFDVLFISSGISYDPANDIASGTGNFLYLEMFSTSSAELSTGTYEFDGDYTGNGYTFDDGSIGINFNVETETGEVEDYVTGGSISIEKSGSIYSFTLSCTTEAGKTLTGSFSGTLQYYDWSEKKTKPSLN